jgi:hypothetical protein
MAMATLRKLALGAIAAGAVTLVSAACAGETSVTPKHVETSHSWLPRDYFKIEKGGLEFGDSGPRDKISETKPKPQRDLDARLWIPGIGCASTAAALDVAASRGVRTCLAAATVPPARPDWIATAIEAAASRRATSVDAPLIS